MSNIDEHNGSYTWRDLRLMSAQGPEYKSAKLQEKFFELEDAMKTILLCATLLILGMQAGCTKTCSEKHWFDGRAFSECVRLGGG